MPRGLPASTAMTISLRANTTGVEPIAASDTASSIVRVSAVASTSTGAPSMSWATKVEEPAALTTTSTPGFVSSNSASRRSNTSVSDEAENTMTCSSDEPHAVTETINPTRPATPAADSRERGMPTC